MPDEPKDTLVAQPSMPSAPPLLWKEQFVSFINQKVENAGKCRECEQMTVAVADDIVTPVRLEGSNMQLGGKMYPQVMLVCLNCGYTRFFNAVLAGVVDGDK